MATTPKTSPAARAAGLRREHDHAVRPTYAFAGGGSGGHLTPGLAVAGEIVRRRPDAEIVFLGSDRPVERRMLAASGYRREAVVRAGRRLGLPVAVSRTHAFLRSHRPEHVVGLGGWASVPGVLAATSLGIPVTLLEQNVVPGRATAWLARLGHPACLAFVETVNALGPHAVVTGNPTRPALTSAASPERPTLLVLGGSQGAHGLNRVVTEAVTRLDPATRRGLRIVHQSGDRDRGLVAARYAALGVDAEVAAHFDDLDRRYAAATLCVTRAGATTLAELALRGVPTVCVPVPRSVRDHQRANARHFAARGAAVLVEEGRDDAATLAGRLTGLLSDAASRSALSGAIGTLGRPDAAGRVVDRLGVPAVPSLAAA